MSRGHIRKRGQCGRWYVVLELPRAKGAPRKQRWIPTKATTKKEAEQELTRYLRELDGGTYLDANKLTVGEYLELWLAGDLVNRIRPTTLAGYEGIVRLHIVPAIGHRRLQSLRPLDIAAFYKDLPSPAVAQNCRAVLSGALRSAVLWGYLATNPVREVTPPRYAPVAGASWTVEEVGYFLTATVDARFCVLYRLALATGLRIGELLALRWADVALEGGRLTVRHTSVRVGGEERDHAPKTGKERVVTLDAETVAALRRHRIRQVEDRLRAGEFWRDEDRLFANATGGVLTADTVREAFKRDAAAAGVPIIRLHDLRHTHASLLLEAGRDPKAVSQRLGHANIAITLDTYQHVTARTDRELADLIGRLLGS